MHIIELSTLLTDYLLAGWSCFLGFRLYRIRGNTSVWPHAFLFLFVSSFLGGTYHGFINTTDQLAGWLLWFLTIESLALASLFIVLAVSENKSNQGKKWIYRIFIGKFIMLSVLFYFEQKFSLVMLNYGVDLLAGYGVLLNNYLRGSDKGTGWFTLALLFTVLGSFFQYIGIAAEPYLNHNDVFHLVQLIAVYFFYRTGLMMIRQKSRVPTGR